MKTRYNQLANQNGQMTIEMLLIGTLLLVFVLTISKTFQEKNLLASVVEGPQTYLVGMAENGVWKPGKDANKFHPNLFKRHISLEGDK
jgi:hypothetical protein